MPSSSLYQKQLMAAAIAAAFPVASLGAGVARVDFAVGNVTAVAPDGRTRPLSRGSEIDVGETVATQQGRAQLRFADGAYMSLQPQTEFKVEEFKYANTGKAEESDSIVMNLLKGGLRTITGLIGRANRNNYRLRTDVATIGIRGTEYSVKYTNSIEVFCADGSIQVENDGGILTLNSGQGGYVASNNTPPQQTENRPVLPPEGPAEQQLQQQQTQTDDPEQPIQEQEDKPLVEEALPEPPPPQTPQILTGTLTGNIAVGHLAFVAEAGVETTLAFDGSGKLLSFDALEFGTGVTQHVGSTRESLGNDGVMAWGRWIDGATSGDLALDLTNEGALHYVAGLPVTNMPTEGIAVYTHTGHTPPTFNGNITSASFTSSTLTVDFLNSQVGVALDLTVNNQPYSGSTVASMGISGNPSVFVTGISMSGPDCVFGSGQVAGFLAGEAAARAGMSYHVDHPAGFVAGAVVYQRGPIDMGQSR